MPKLLRAQSQIADGNLSLRHDPPEVVLPRREVFLSTHGIDSQQCVYMQTEHEDKVTHVGQSDKGTDISTEALVTNEIGVILNLLTADCFPVVLYDPVEHVVALAHLGWKPANKKLAAKVVQEMCSRYSCKAGEILVYMGPGIQKESYRFVDPLQKQLSDWSSFLTDLADGEVAIDLMGYIQHQLRQSGILPEHIHSNVENTATSEVYFSHYRSMRTREPEGRFATIVGLME